MVIQIILGKKIKGKVYENQDEICIHFTDIYSHSFLLYFL